MLAVLVVGMSLLTVVIQSVIHRAERKELYNRIMARDLNEYRASGKKEPKKPGAVNNLLKKRIDNSYRAQSGGEE